MIADRLTLAALLAPDYESWWRAALGALACCDITYRSHEPHATFTLRLAEGRCPGCGGRLVVSGDLGYCAQSPSVGWRLDGDVVTVGVTPSGAP